MSSLNYCIFFKTSASQSSADPEILTYASHCSTKLQPILDCFIPKFKLKHKDQENIKTNCVNTVVFNLRQIKRRTSFWDTRQLMQAIITHIGRLSFYQPRKMLNRKT